MHVIQRRLLELSKRENLAKLSLREMAGLIGLKREAPQKIKHHLAQLEKRGFLAIDRIQGTMGRVPAQPSWARGLLESTARVFSLPIVGTANCGPATIFAEQNFEGFLKVSSRLLGRAQPTGLYAIRADGSSMNLAEVAGRRIEDGDLVIVDGRRRSAVNGDIVVAIIECKATIKEFVDDRENDQIVLRARSTFDYEPIHLHSDDDFSISGKVIGVVKKPRDLRPKQD